MNELETDLQNSHKNIVQWLNQYEKVSEDIISLNHTIKLHNILDAISGSDLDKIKTCESEANDQIVRKHLQAIASKIQEQKSQPQKVPAVEPQKPEPPKRQSRIAEKVQVKKDGKKQSGIIGSFINRFKSKEKKPSEIILPDQEPDCTWDPVRRVYVFAGQEPQAPKEVPKPPPKGQRKAVEQKKPAQMSQIDSLTAPPTFKRKGAAKPKTKAKEQILLPPPEQEPMNFAKVMNNINQQYQQLFQKIKSGCYEKPISHTHLITYQDLSEFMEVAERIVSASEEVAKEEHHLIDKLGKELSISKENQLMQNLVKQISESSNIYQLVNTTLDDLRKDVVYKHPQVIRKYYSKKEQQAHDQSQLTISRQQIERLNNELEKMIQEKSDLMVKMNNNEHFQMLIQEKNDENKRMYEEKCYLEGQIEELKRQINQSVAREGHRWQQIQMELLSKEEELSTTVQQYKRDNNLLQQKIEQLKGQNLTLKNEKLQMEQNYRVSQATLSNSSGKLNQQMEREKLKIQTQLKFYEQKEKTYLTNIKNMEQHNNFIYQLQKTLQQENHLLSNIMEKRLNIGNNTNNEELLSLKTKQIDLSSPHTVILELSDIINSITLTHLDRLQLFNRNYSHLHKKYLQSKQMVKTIKNNASNENTSLNRSVTRLKKLIETYKEAKEQSEERCKLLELQIEKLKKRLEHFKQQDKFNKSYLMKLKPSKSNNNQNDSFVSLQQDNQELAQTIEDLQNDLGMKNQNNIKLQKDLEDILVLYEKLQGRLTQVEKKGRQNQKIADLLKEEKEQLMNKVNLLEVKLANQKEKNDDLNKNLNNRLRKAEQTWDKKVKLLKEDMQRALQAEDEMSTELKEQKELHHDKIKQLERAHKQRERELQQSLHEKQSENSQLLLLVDDFNFKIQQKDSQLSQLEKENIYLKERQDELANSIHDYNESQLQTLKQSEQMHNSMIHKLLAEYKELQSEEINFRREYEQKIAYLSQQLVESNQQSEQLLRDLQQYSQLVSKMDQSLEQLKQQHQKAKDEHMHVVDKLKEDNSQLTELVTALEEELQNGKKSQQVVEDNSALLKLQEENTQLTELVTALQDQLESKKKQTEDLEQLAQTITGQLSELKVKNSELKKQKDDINQQMWSIAKQMEVKEDEINNKSESLLIKSEELEQKNQMMMDREQNFVLTKEELQGLKNEIKQKQGKIIQLKRDIQTMENLVEEQDNEHLRLQIILKDTQGMNQGLMSEIEQLRYMNQDLTSEIKQLRQQAKSTPKDIDLDKDSKEKEVQGEIEYLLKEIEGRQNQITDLKGKNRQLLQQLQTIRKELIDSKNVDLDHDKKEKQVQGEIQFLLKDIQLREKQIIDLKQNNQELQEQLQRIKGSLLQSKNVDLDHDKKEKQVQGQIQYLLKEIQSRQGEIDELKEQNRKLLAQNQELKKVNAEEESQIQATEKDVEGQMEYLLKQIDAKENEISELKDSIKLLEGSINQKNYDHEKLAEKLFQVQTQNKELQQKIMELQKADRQIDQYENSETVQKLQAEVKAKQHQLTDMEINKQETERLLFVAQNENRQFQATINDLQNKIGELAELLQAQQDVINKQAEGEDNQMVKTLRETIEAKTNEVRETKKDLEELSRTLVSKSFDYENKIESLERELSSVSSLKLANRKLEDSVKALELENSSLLDEKVELMRSNDNLVKINEKLIIELSPHTKLSQKYTAHPKQEKSVPKKPQSKEPEKKDGKPDKEEQSAKSPTEKEQPKKQEKKDPKDQKTSELEKKNSSGFMNTLSSWFLTPTETDRLSK